MSDGNPNIPKNGDPERSQEIPEEAMARLIEILTLMGEGASREEKRHVLRRLDFLLGGRNGSPERD